MLDIIIVGAGGFGREVYLWAGNSLSADEYRIKGFLSHDANILDRFEIGVPILGTDDSYEIQETDRFLMAIGNVQRKKSAVELLIAKGAKFIRLIDKTAIVAGTATVGKGVVICPNAIVSDHVKIDDFAMLNFFSSCGHDSKIGKYSILSPYATLNGMARIEDEVFLGTHATVMGNLTVGTKSKINANSVAMRDIAPKSYVIGVPGKAMAIF